MNQENVDPNKPHGEGASEQEHPPTPVAQTKDRGEETPRTTDQRQNPASVPDIADYVPMLTPEIELLSGWSGFGNWFRRITVAEAGMLALTLVIAGTTIYYAKYAKRQWTAMSDQVTAMQGQLSEMQKQTGINRDELVGTQAAILDLGINFPDTGELEINLDNRGHVIAKNVRLHFSASKNVMSTGARIGNVLNFDPQVSPIGLDRGFDQKWAMPWHPRELGEETNPPHWPEGWPGKVTYTFWGHFSYDDGFGDEINEWFCKEWVPNFHIVFTRQVTGGGGLFNCEEMTQDVRLILKQEEEAKEGAEHPN